MPTRVCSRCGLEKDVEQFPLRNRFTQRRQSYCIDCRSEYRKDWYGRNKNYQAANARKHSTEYRDAIREYLWNYKATHPCEGILPNGERCMESDPVVLEFHHLYGKDMAIAEMVTRVTV